MVELISNSYGIRPPVYQPVRFNREPNAADTVSNEIIQQSSAQLFDALSGVNEPVVGNGAVPSGNLDRGTLLQAQEELFNTIDENTDGSLTLEEFTNGPAVNQPLAEDELNELFTATDLNEDGLVSEDEFGTAVLLERLNASAAEDGVVEFAAGTPVTFYDPRDTNLDGFVDAQERLTDLLGQNDQQAAIVNQEESLSPEATRTSMMSYLLSIQEAQQGAIV